MALDKPQIVEHASKSINFTAFDIKWVPSSAKIIVLGSYPRSTGAFRIYELRKGELNLILENEKSKPFKCGTFGATSYEQRHLATGSFDGKLQTWDLQNTEFPVFSVNAHTQIINAIDGVGVGAPEIVTGSRDGVVKVWDIRQNSPVATMEPGKGENKRDCWTVTFGHSHSVDERRVCAGYDNGDLKMFDLRTMSVLWETNVKNGVCSIEFDRKDIEMNKMVVTTLESNIHVFDLRTLHQTKGFASLIEKAHKSTIWCAKHLPQNRDVFMSCGGNGSLNLWKYNYPDKRKTNDSEGHEEGKIGSLTKLQSLAITQQPIATFDWNLDKIGLGVCGSFDQTIRTIIVTKLDLF